MPDHPPPTTTIRNKRLRGLASCAILAVAALVLVLIMTSGAREANRAFYERWPLDGDTASYWIRDLRLNERAMQMPYADAVWEEARDNRRDPLRTLVVGLSGSDAAVSVNGHLGYGGLTAGLFLFALGFCVWRRTDSAAYGVYAQAAAVLVAGLYLPAYGLPSKLPDLPASFLLGAGQCLLLAGRGRAGIWLPLLAGVFLGLATLARYHAWIYGLFICGPILVLFVVRTWFGGKPRPWLACALPLLAFFGGFLLVAGRFLAIASADVFNFYAVGGYAFNVTVLSSLQTTGAKLLWLHIGPLALAGWALTAAAYAAFRWPGFRKIDPWDFAAIAWSALSCLGLLLLVMRVQDDFTQGFYAVPGILLACVAPYATRLPEGVPARFTTYAWCGAVVLTLGHWAAFRNQVTSENYLYPRERMASQAELNRNMAGVVAALLPPGHGNALPGIDTNFNYHARFLIPTLYERYGRPTRFANCFQIRESQWRLAYTGDEARDGELVAAALISHVDLFFALERPEEPAALEVMKDAHTARMAAKTNAAIAARPDIWEDRGVIPGGPWGPVRIYANRFRHVVFALGQPAFAEVGRLIATDAAGHPKPRRANTELAFIVPSGASRFLLAPDGRPIPRHGNFEDLARIITDNEPEQAEQVRNLRLGLEAHLNYLVLLDNPLTPQAELLLPRPRDRTFAQLLKTSIAGAPESWRLVGRAPGPWNDLLVYTNETPPTVMRLREGQAAAGAAKTNWWSKLASSIRELWRKMFR